MPTLRNVAALADPIELALHARRIERGGQRPSTWLYISRGDFKTLMTAPVIYSVLVPLLLLDAWVSAYQAVCFRAWGIRRVRRRAYFVFDRHALTYLNGLERLNCTFCSYANGLFAFVGEVAARTEQYWCPIRHERPPRGAHRRAGRFAPFGDADAYERLAPPLRAQLRHVDDCAMMIPVRNVYRRIGRGTAGTCPADVRSPLARAD